MVGEGVGKQIDQNTKCTLLQYMHSFNTHTAISILV